MRRGAFFAVLAATLALAPPGVAAVPPGPRLATVELINTKGSERDEKATAPFMSLATIDPSKGGERRFLRSKLEATGRVTPTPFFGPAWSPDGGRLAFLGYPKLENEKARIYAVNADGSGLAEIPGTMGGTNPVFSPDGDTLAFARSRFRSISSTATFLVDIKTGTSRRLTRWRDGLSNVPGAFTPDGSELLLSQLDDHFDSPRVVQLNLASGQAREVLEDATEPALSPDGSRIAFVGYLHPDLVEGEENRDYLAGDLYVASADGSDVRRLSRTDDVLESSPSWDPSGQRIGYVQFRADTSFVPGLGLLFPAGNALMQVNADGTCRKRILSRKRVAFYGVAWQPGADRGAGSIAC